jgi:hypothetical protein
VTTLTTEYLDNLGLRVLLSSKEMAKACVSYNLGRTNLANGDLMSTGVNFYYALYHSCLSVISSTSAKIPVNQCVAEMRMIEKLPRYYVPLSHSETKTSIAELDDDLAKDLEHLMKIRKYLSYGPNILYKGDEKGIHLILVYTCKFKDLQKEIESFSSKLPNLISQCCELLKKKLNDTNFFYFIFESFMMIEVLCDDLNLKKNFIDECGSILNAYDEKGKIREMVKGAKNAK